MLGEYLENVRKKKPLVHNITNYVTVNDVANVLLEAVLSCQMNLQILWISHPFAAG